MVGCEDISLVLGDIAEEMRGEQADEGRAGTLRALEVTHRAAGVAEAIARRPDPSCALAIPDAGFVYTVELEITREARFESDVRWSETREFFHDPSGHLRLAMRATYQDELGKQGAHEPVRVVIDDVGYEGPDPTHVYKRHIGPRERSEVTDAGLGTFQTLIDSVPGWARQEGERAWQPGDEPLVCGRRDASGRGWLRRLSTRGSIVEASLQASGDSRVFEARWLLEDGVVMQVRARDRVEPFEGAIEAPAPEHVIEVRRQRDWKRVDDLLDRLEQKGAI